MAVEHLKCVLLEDMNFKFNSLLLVVDSVVRNMFRMNSSVS